MTKAAIMQSNYIPWKGYFDLLNSVDHFIIYDTVQYTKNDWRNRNKIKTSEGVKWLTVPVQSKGSLGLKIKDVKVADFRWQKKHWGSLRQFYSKAAYFAEYGPPLEQFYLNNRKQYLSEINVELITIVNSMLGIDTCIHYSEEFQIGGGKTERLIDICKNIGADTYVTGPSAANYLDGDLFAQEQITVEWIDYEGYPEYSQMFPPIDHGVSIVDLIFNEGPYATQFMKSFR